ncbi:MAG TPA: hypothetical protein VFP42_06875 [Acidimicrobiia bacterium]|nr:hypothetical protein [Acidimicrobiia bacterium]
MTGKDRAGLLGLVGALKDCEAVAGELLGQRVNSLTALGFIVVGIVILVRTERVWVGVGAIGTGIGSFVFHGPMPSWGQLVHDVTLWFLVGVVTFAIGRDLRSGASWRALIGPLALLAVVALIGRLGATGGPLCDPGSVVQPHGLWHLGAASALLWWAMLYPTPTRNETTRYGVPV